MRLHIRGPYVPPGGDLRRGCALWLCYDPDQPNLSVAGISPTLAYRTWQAIYNTKPLERVG